MNAELTLPETKSETRIHDASPSRVLALVLVGSAEETGREGEVFIVPPGNPGPYALIGRGEASESDPHPRLNLERQRPGRVFHALAINSSKVSRLQLRLRALGDEAIEVENMGRLKLHHNGIEKAVFRLAEGDTLEVGSQLVFLCVRRPAFLMGPTLDDGFPFGDADPHGIVGESAAVWEVRQRITFVGPRAGHVLVRGQSGTGKELVARALHAASNRAKRKLVARNAATIPKGLISAELFGNLKNYPNPGMSERPGLIGEANGSTLFLDEVGEIDTECQASLLRVLDAGEYHRLGEERSRQADLRFVAATNRPEEALKHDLLARLVFRIETPSLNERREDIPLLAKHILRRIAKEDAAIAQRFFARGHPRLSVALVRMLVRHTYVTNIRELETLLWQALSESRGEVIEAPVRPPPVPVAETVTEPRPIETDDDSMDGLSAAKLQACLDEHNGVIEDAARAIGKSRHALGRLIRKYGLVVRKRPK